MLFYSGGTEVTVTGHQLNSITEPQINLIVVTARNTSNIATSYSNLEVS